jgi:hypothetical protein
MENQIIMCINLGATLLRTTSDDEMTKKKKVCIWNFCYFEIYIRFKLYKISPNCHPRGDLISHPYFEYIENLEAIRVDKHQIN